MFCQYQSAYCKNCGQLCQPEPYIRSPEAWDLPGSLIKDWRSPCCKDELSEDPVSGRCDRCGATVDCSAPELRMEKFTKIGADLFCKSCLKDYQREKEKGGEKK